MPNLSLLGHRHSRCPHALPEVHEVMHCTRGGIASQAYALHQRARKQVTLNVMHCRRLRSYESLTKLRLVLQTGICQKKFSMTNFICLFFPQSVSTVQPLQKLLTLLTVGLKISQDVDFEYIRKFSSGYLITGNL
jgi:hypothetical protein